MADTATVIEIRQALQDTVPEYHPSVPEPVSASAQSPSVASSRDKAASSASAVPVE